MSLLRIFALGGLACLFGAFAVQCSKPTSEKPATATAPAGSLKPEDDYKATMDAYNKVKDPDDRLRLWLDFLGRNPNNRYTLGTINYVVRNHYLDQKKDLEGAVKFTVEHMSKITDEKLKRRADMQLIRLYGKVGRKDQLRELAGRTGTRRELTADEHLEVADAAIEAKDWDFARQYCEALLKKNTVEKIRSKVGSEKRTDQELQKEVDQNRGRATFILGRAALESNDTESALVHFTEAGKLARHDYAGLTCWPLGDLNVHWAKALLKSGNARSALQKISKDAIIQEKKEALELLADAHKSAGIKGDLQGYIERTRPAIARSMPSFYAYDYDKRKVSYDQLKGRVTMLAFWFPT
jgi:hypothetical protein